jgi:hypothetical protein
MSKTLTLFDIGAAFSAAHKLKLTESLTGEVK